MSAPAKIRKLDEVVVNRIAAGEIIQRPANALKELIENSLDAKSTNIQITAKEGGMKLLQIQDNGTGIRREDMEIVCERFTTSKLQKFEDLRSISTFGFRGEALASISHVALLTITTKTADEKCAYKATYIDSKLKTAPKACAGNQGTTITIENLFYNVPTRKKALSSASEEFNRISEVVTRYAVHNPTVGFVLKKHGEATPQVRTPHNSTKVSNIRTLYGNPVARELLEVEFEDESYRFKTHCLITNPNYNGKRMVLLLFINHRLVDSTSIKKMLEDLYSIYLPKKTHPWCYVSLEINPSNVDVNVHPTKHEVKFLHEDSIIEKLKNALDEKLASNGASRTFYLQARLPKADVTTEVLKEVLPEYEDKDKTKKVQPRELIRADRLDQKLDRFNFTINPGTSGEHDKTKVSVNNLCENDVSDVQSEFVRNVRVTVHEKVAECNVVEKVEVANEMTHGWSTLVDEITSVSSQDKELPIEESTSSTSKEPEKDLLEDIVFDVEDDSKGEIMGVRAEEAADEAYKRVRRYFGDKLSVDEKNRAEEAKVEAKSDRKINEEVERSEIREISKPSELDKCNELNKCNEPNEPSEIRKFNEPNEPGKSNETSKDDQEKKSAPEFKSYSVNNFRRELRLTSVLRLRKEVEDNYHEGLREILSNVIFIGCVDETSAFVQSGVNLYLCNTAKLAEELFYEIMLYDFANYGLLQFSSPVSLYELALLGLETEEAGWTEDVGSKEELATNAKDLLLEKADMMRQYFSIVIDKKGYLRSLPVLLDKYYPNEAGLPLFVLRLATEVNWTAEQPCFRDVCRETARYFSEMNPVHGERDWKYVTEHVLYPAIKESLLPPRQFAHDSTILQITSLPELYKVFERC